MYLIFRERIFILDYKLLSVIERDISTMVVLPTARICFLSYHQSSVESHFMQRILLYTFRWSLR